MSDGELRARNKLASRAWRKKNQGYWRERREHDRDYTNRNRELQRRRDAQDRVDLANTDTIGAIRREKLKRIGVLIHLANTDPIQVSWTLVSEEIRLFLQWRERLANTNAIDSSMTNETQSLL
jgi:hypothetical protein